MTITPAPHADMSVQVGNDRNDVIGGGPNFFGRGGGGGDDGAGGGGGGDEKNKVEILRDLNEISDSAFATPDIKSKELPSTSSLEYNSVPFTDKSYTSLFNDLESMMANQSSNNIRIVSSRRVESTPAPVVNAFNRPKGLAAGYNAVLSDKSTNPPHYSGKAQQYGNEFTPIQSSSNNLLRDIRFESTNQAPSGYKPFSKLAQQMEEMEARYNEQKTRYMQL